MNPRIACGSHRTIRAVIANRSAGQTRGIARRAGAGQTAKQAGAIFFSVAKEDGRILAIHQIRARETPAYFAA